MCGGVSKSGSPIARLMMSLPSRRKTAKRSAAALLGDGLIRRMRFEIREGFTDVPRDGDARKVGPARIQCKDGINLGGSHFVMAPGIRVSRMGGRAVFRDVSPRMFGADA